MTEPRQAATVLLLRDGAPGLEVYLLRRTKGMPFAGGMTAYIGGGVDPRDGDVEIAWVGPSPASWAEAFGCDERTARELVCAAVRETFEEAGLLLAGAPDGELAVPDGPGWAADRAALTAGEITLAQLLDRHGLVLRADLLTPWARWITPEAEPRRFDARFFAAALPPGQQAAGHAAESDQTSWLRPAEALSAARDGEISLLPPTAATLAEFAAATGIEDILTRERSITPIQPTLINDNGHAWLEVPDDIGYPL